ncbi:hypothetical protein DRQ50_13295 [bacterium]|nr:MAG: hypothetical protein DRQ50_13295 [bacterium]
MVYSCWPLIIAAGIGLAIVTSGMSDVLLLPMGIATVSLHIIVYGRIISQAVPGRPATNWEILKEYSRHYLLTAVITGVVFLVPRLLVARLASSTGIYYPASIGVHAALSMLTIYVWPLVFLRRSSVGAILAGVSYLWSNLAASVWILVVVSVTQVLHGVGLLVFRTYLSGWSYAVLFSIGVVTAFLLFMSFAAALHTLLSNRRDS